MVVNGMLIKDFLKSKKCPTEANFFHVLIFSQEIKMVSPESTSCSHSVLGYSWPAGPWLQIL